MQISDDIQLGPVVLGTVNTAGPSPMEVGVGPLGRVYIFDAVPLTLQAAGLAALQTAAGAGNLTLTAGTGVTTTTSANGTVNYVLDMARNVTLTSAGNISAVTFTVYGVDQYGQAMSEAITGPNASTVAGVKCFKSVNRVAVSGAVGTNTSVGFGDVIGLPLRLLSRDYVIGANFNATAVALSAFTVADTTSPATTTTGDVRGKVTLPSAADGSKRLVVALALPAIAVGPNATRIGAAGVTQA